MREALEVLAAIDAILINWNEIQLRLPSPTKGRRTALAKLGLELQAAATCCDPGTLAALIDKLRLFLNGTPVEAYLESLLRRTALGDSFEQIAASQPRARLPEFELQGHLTRSGEQLGEALASSADAPSTALVNVPLFFATNRERLAANGAQSAFGDISSSLSYGFLPVGIPLARHRVGRVETPHWWNIFAKRQPASNFVTPGDIDTMTAAQFQTQLGSTLAETATRDLLIFLHGYNVTFEEAVRRAAQIACDTQFGGIMVLFSWPSLGSLARYAADEDRAAASADDLAHFLAQLAGGPWRRVHCLAHSMGNRVLLLGLADNPRPALPLGELVLAAADVYVPVFCDKFPKIEASGHLAATSYASKRDHALLFSDLLHKGDRIGLIRGVPYVSQGLETIDASAVDGGLLGHGYFAEQRALLDDLSALLARELPASRRALTSAGTYWTFPRGTKVRG